MTLPHSAIQAEADAAERNKVKAEAAELTWRMQEAARKAERDYYAERPSMKGKLAVHRDIGVSPKRDPVFKSLAGRLVQAFIDKQHYVTLTNTAIINTLSKNLGVKVAGNYLSKSPSKHQRAQVAEVLAKSGLPTQWAALPLSKIKRLILIRRILNAGGTTMNKPVLLSTEQVICGDRIFPVDKSGRVVVGRYKANLNFLLEMFDVFNGAEIPDLRDDRA